MATPLVVLLDRSGSSTAPMIADQQVELSREFIESCQQEGRTVAVFGYSGLGDRADLHELKSFDSAAAPTRADIDKFGGGGTMTADALLQLGELIGGPAEIVVITDGVSFSPDQVAAVVASLPEGSGVFGLIQGDVFGRNGPSLSSLSDGLATQQFGDRWMVADNAKVKELMSGLLSEAVHVRPDLSDEVTASTEAPASASSPGLNL